MFKPSTLIPSPWVIKIINIDQSYLVLRLSAVPFRSGLTAWWSGFDCMVVWFDCMVVWFDCLEVWFDCMVGLV